MATLKKKPAVLRVGKLVGNAFDNSHFPYPVLNGGGKPVAQATSQANAEMIVAGQKALSDLTANPDALVLGAYAPLLRLGIRVIPALDGKLPLFLVRSMGSAAYNVVHAGELVKGQPNYDYESVKLFSKRYSKTLLILAQEFVKALLASFPKEEPVQKPVAKKPVVKPKKQVAKAVSKPAPKAKKAPSVNPLSAKKSSPKAATPVKHAKPATVKKVKQAQADVYGQEWPDPLA